MGKAWGLQVQADNLEGLSLSFVDGHYKAGAERELDTLEGEWTV